MDNLKYKRNFCIIAHIDHGKSTLADRLIEKSNIIQQREYKNQILDSMDIERERGITIKSQAVTLNYKAKDGNTYELNLVDTPGHVDFSYEVSRALKSCEGALLLIDATQGTQAQTLANMYMALENDLEIIPVINKIDMQAADINMVKKQIDTELGLDIDMTCLISAKNGIGIDDLFESIVKYIPHPIDQKDNTKALIFDAHYDPYKGVMAHIRVFSGSIKAKDKIKFFSNEANYDVIEVGKFKIAYELASSLECGDVGYILAGIKTISDIKIGDTITLLNNPCKEILSGFKEVQPVVFSSIYPIDANDFEELSKSIEKLKLNDASLTYDKSNSQALGIGFKCGFLGMLHLEIVQERLEREFDMSIVLTAPSVRYKLVLKKNNKVIFIEAPEEMPDPMEILESQELYIKATIISPDDYLGGIMNLVSEKRGIQKNMKYIDKKRVELIYEMPLSEVLFDFYDRLKSTSKGYASFEYEVLDYRLTNLVKLDILLNSKVVDALSQLVFRDNAEKRARIVCKKLKQEIPRKQFQIPIQGAVGHKIIARETISALKKDVTAKCYGGDITRKKKLIEKQKEGKKRMKMIGNVELPQKVFLSVMKTSDDD